MKELCAIGLMFLIIRILCLVADQLLYPEGQGHLAETFHKIQSMSK